MDVLSVALPIVAPVLAAGAALAMGWRRSVAVGAIVASAVVLVVGVGTAVSTADGGAVEAGSWFRIDALSAVLLIVIGAVGVIATCCGLGYVEDELAAGHTDAAGARRYGVLVPLFLAAMVLAVVANNLGVLWAAIEATTIVTAFLVGHRGSRRSLEATWKYVVICSVGIALAYLGTVLVNYAAKQAGVAAHGTLDWTVLAAHSGELDQGVMRLAFGLLVLGFGTKAGLIPMHSWLPDAHSQAPAPVSALMSGVLLPVAVYGLARYRVIAIDSAGPGFVRVLLLTVALASLLLAAGLLLAQRDYKRLLAYSSIEHMSLAVIGLAIGTPLAVAATLLHIIGHGLTKSVLFCTAGEILNRERTTRIASVQALLTRAPLLAGLFAAGLVALLGLPPFSLFASELSLLRAGLNAHLLWPMAAVLLLLLIAFTAITVKTTGLLLGTSGTTTASAGLRVSVVVPLVVGLVLVGVLGVVGWPLGRLLAVAGTIVGVR